MSKSLTQLRDEIYANAKAKGFHDTPRSFGDDIALIGSELSEAYEDYRAGLAPCEPVYTNLDGARVYDFEAQMGPGVAPRLNKPCGIPSELADALIRILDTCGLYGIDIERAVEEKIAYNATRSHRHGGKIV